MNKYIVKNCPAGQIVTSAINPNMAGVYCKMTHGPCQDAKECVIKKIVELCRKDFFDATSIPEILSYKKEQLTDSGLMARMILKLLDTEEV